MTITSTTSLEHQTDEYHQQLAFVREQQRLLTLSEIELQRRIQNGEAGAVGEAAVVAEVQRVVVDLGQAEWRLLVDRAWPGSRGNIDVMLVGPPGVVILDAKNWRETRIEGGRLWRGEAPMDDEVEKVRRQADAVVDALAGDPVSPTATLAPTSAIPMLVLARRRMPAQEVDGVTVVGEKDLHLALIRLARRLDNAAVDSVAKALDRICPPRITPARADVPEPRHAAPAPVETADDAAPEALFEPDEVWRALLDAACAQPIETWMTWLHPTQTALVTRSFSGPARVRGVAGSGKTVVALHRARHLARHPESRVLVTTFVRNLPEVQRTLFARLSPSTASRVEFVNLHAWARRLLTARGVQVDLGEAGRDARSALNRAWASSGVARDLSSIAPQTYWQDEISHVIKGRGLTSLDDYVGLDRVGRRTPLRAEQRQLVWRLYERYQSKLAEDGVADYDDLIARALESVLQSPLERAYTAVIVDEAQDLSCLGMRLLHAVAGDGPDGLLVVGDGQQAVYPGGYTLKEAGVSVIGRSAVLTRNYRNGSDILAAALEVVKTDDFIDLDVERDGGARSYETERPGGVVRRFPSVDRRSQREELVADLRIQLAQGARPGDIAILVRSVTRAAEWMQALGDAGIPVQDLAAYDGSLRTGVKVGTYQRAKGLEFAQVYVPDLDAAVTAPSGDADPEGLRERNELERRCLFVAMTRARDRLWLGTVARA